MRRCPHLQLGSCVQPAPLESVAGHLRDLRSRQHSAGSHLRIGYEASVEFVAPAHAAGESVAVAQPTREMLQQAFGGSLVDAIPLLAEQHAVKTPAQVKLKILEVGICGGQIGNDEGAKIPLPHSVILAWEQNGSHSERAGALTGVCLGRRGQDGDSFLKLAFYQAIKVIFMQVRENHQINQGSSSSEIAGLVLRVERRP